MIDQFHEHKFTISSFGMSNILEWSTQLLYSNIFVCPRVICSTEVKNKWYNVNAMTNCWHQK